MTVTTMDTPRVRTTRLSISEVITAWADATLERASSHIPGQNNWYGTASRYYSPDQPSLVAEGSHIISRGTLLGLRFDKENAMQNTVADRYWYLLNADSFPRGSWGSTHAISDAQSDIRRALTNREHYLIPFSALRAAGLEPDELDFLDKRADSVVQVPADECRFCHRSRAVALQLDNAGLACDQRGHYEEVEEPVVYSDGETPIDPMTGKPYMRVNHRYVRDDAPHVYTRDEHLMGASLFRVHSTDEVRVPGRSEFGDDGWRTIEKDRYFISGIDETATGVVGRGYFLTELVTSGQRHPETLDEAYEWLKPESVKQAEDTGVEVRRQGEWFFIRQDDEMNQELNAQEHRAERELARRRMSPEENIRFQAVRADFKNVPIPSPEAETWDGRAVRRTNNHIAFRLLKREDTMYVRGKITHASNEHQPISLPEGVWYRVVHNVQVLSWSAGNGGGARVD